jgi:deoxyribodipyrimidine photolyase
VASITTDISHHLIVEKDLTPDEAQDTMMILFTTSNMLLDRYNGRSKEWYTHSINELTEALQKEGE